MAFETKNDAELDQLIINYERVLGGRDLPLYRELLEERGRRSDDKQVLKLNASLEHLKQTAIAQSSTSYRALGEASGVLWAEAWQMMSGPGRHLDRLLDLCRVRGLPLLTAICVNLDGLESCELGEGALKGFAACAERLGFRVDDPLAFHHQCREECWAWGRQQMASQS